VQVLQARLDIKRMRIEGHTDNKGSDNYNLNLSNKRAASVVRYLKEHGVSAERLTSVGFGFRCPLVSNATPDGQAQNRRVDFIILEQDGVEPTVPTCKPEVLLKK
jgi:outer membrane protein OmpA-like peptidoglycan-associated protein